MVGALGPGLCEVVGREVCAAAQPGALLAVRSGHAKDPDIRAEGRDPRAHRVEHHTLGWRPLPVGNKRRWPKTLVDDCPERIMNPLLLVASFFLVVRPGVPSSFLFLEKP